MTRRYAWADVGARAFGHAPNGHWKTTTFLAGLTCEGLIAPFVLDGPINAECFFAYVEQILVPVLRKGDTVILDNLSSHKNEEAARLIADAGARLLFLPPYSPDLNPIEQVFANLIGNAAAYLDPSRSGLIEVGERTGAENTSGLATVYVRDNGLGIAAAHMNKLFVPFERLHGDRAKGEGVGLALVKRVVDRHGGRVWAESTQGAGTTFFVSLRRADVTVTPGGGPFAADTRTNSGAVFQ